MRLDTAEKRLSARWIPKDATKIENPDGLGTAYIAPYFKNRDTSNSLFVVVGYAGSAAHASVNQYFKTREAAEKQVAEFFTSLMAHKVMVAERRAEHNKPHTLQVGDVITNSWGYDQTNVDAYQVTRKTDHYVWLRELATKQVENEGHAPMAGYVVPVPGEFTGTEEVKHKASEEYVSFKFGSGSKWDGTSKLYNSWYA